MAQRHTEIEGFFGAYDYEYVHSGAPLPLYHRLYSLLKKKILSGEIGVGETFPGEGKIATSLDISRITVNRSLNILANENLISRERGIGSVVVFDRQVDVRSNTPIEEMIDNSRGPGTLHSKTVSIAELLLEDSPVRDFFDFVPNKKVIHAQTVVKHLKGNLMSFQESWTDGLNFDDCPEPFDHDTRNWVLRANGIFVHNSTQQIRAANASRNVAKHLGIREREPLLVLFCQSFDQLGSAVELTIDRYPASEVKYTVEQARLVLCPDLQT